MPSTGAREFDVEQADRLINMALEDYVVMVVADVRSRKAVSPVSAVRLETGSPSKLSIGRSVPPPPRLPQQARRVAFCGANAGILTPLLTIRLIGGPCSPDVGPIKVARGGPLLGRLPRARAPSPVDRYHDNRSSLPGKRHFPPSPVDALLLSGASVASNGMKQ